VITPATVDTRPPTELLERAIQEEIAGLHAKMDALQQIVEGPTLQMDEARTAIAYREQCKNYLEMWQQWHEATVQKRAVRQ
jgi:hypothetical protein